MRVRRHLRNVYVVVVGPDGSGKSEITTRVAAGLYERGIAVRRLHFIPREHRVDDSPVTRPHAAPPRRLVTEALSVIHRFARYFFAGIGGTLARGFGGVQLQERGWMDQVADPARYRLTTRSSALVKALASVVRHPDLMVACDGDAREMAARKGELDTDGVTAQLAFWRRNPADASQVATAVTTEETSTHSARHLLSAIDSARSQVLREALRTVGLAPARLEMQASSNAGPAVRALYRPSKLRGVVGRELGIALLRRPHRPTVGDLPFDTRMLLDGCGLLDYDEAAIIRSSERNRWVIGLVRAGTLETVIKVSSCDDPSLVTEAEWLRELRHSDGTFRVPKIIKLKDIDVWRVLAMQAMPALSLRSRPDFGLALDLCVALAKLRGGVGVTHGDLAPWNIVGRRRPWLVDWEGARDYEAGADLAHYVLVSTRLGRAVDPRTARALLSPGSPLLRSFADRTGQPLAEVHEGVDAYVRWAHPLRHIVGNGARSVFGEEEM